MSGRDAPSRLVIRPPNWLGDAVLALPAMTALRRAWPEAHLVIAAPASVLAVFREETGVRPDALIELSGGASASTAALANARFDTGVLFPNSFRSAWVLRSAGIPHRWGYRAAGRGWLLTRRPRRPRRADARHQADYYRELVRRLGVPCDADVLPSITASAGSLEAADALLAAAPIDPARPLVGVAPGAAYGQAKQWPPARVAEVIARLVREAGARCVIVGAAHDRAASREIESWLRREAPDVLDQVVDLVGGTTLGALVGVLARTDAFVANDSGAMHLAAAVGRPVVAIFGPTDEQATRPLGGHDVLTASVFCRPCLMRDCPIDHRCMKRIDASRVVDAVVGRLAAAGTPAP